MSINDPGTSQGTGGYSGASTNSGKSESSATGTSAEATTTSRLAAAAHSAVDKAATNLEKAEHAVREAHPVATASDAALSFSQALEDSVKAYIHQYPLRSMGIGLAAGYLLSVMLKK